MRARAVKGEELEVIESVAYLHTPHGFGKSKIAEKFAKWIGVTNTTRNWNTVLRGPASLEPFWLPPQTQSKRSLRHDA